MRRSTRIAFVLFMLGAISFLTAEPARAFLDPCEQFGDLTLGEMHSNCYPDDPFFCTDGDNWCWQIAPQYGCGDTAWYGICWDGDNPCDYYCCCRRT